MELLRTSQDWAEPETWTGTAFFDTLPCAGLNYMMEAVRRHRAKMKYIMLAAQESPQQGRIRFVGALLQNSASEEGEPDTQTHEFRALLSVVLFE